jgi:hypothetical protein
MYIANKGHININGEQEAHNIGVKQGDETSPKLFSIFFD